MNELPLLNNSSSHFILQSKKRQILVLKGFDVPENNKLCKEAYFLLPLLGFCKSRVGV
jgi:hypothetical protein